ncbi:trichohyalin-like isoform X2 [Syngnathus typhle]|uniref:trichohyalin-like isoform X2 n=1 Tax=Syngnathus typhle TaxID=161592 RepID=UPI002A69A0B2|nr:trichohyalin-like isoform X2 [Syngnathus typhle]
MRKTEQLSQIKQGGKHELEFLRIIVSKQQREIERLKDERHDLNILVRTLKLQMKHFTLKVEMSKNLAMKEQMLLHETLTVINRESHILGRQHTEIKIKQHNLKLINFSKLEEHKQSLNELTCQIRQWSTSDCSLITNNWKTITGAKQAKLTKQYMQESMVCLNQAIIRNGKEVSQLENEIKHIINTMTVIVKHSENILTQMKTRTKKQKDKEFFEKTSMFFESCVPGNSEQLGDILKHTVNTQTHMEEEDIWKRLIHTRKQQKTNNIKTVNANKHRIYLEEKKARKLMNLVRKQIAKEFTKRKVKSIKCQAKKMIKLHQKLEQTMKEKDELEILKMKLQKQREKEEDLMQCKHCCPGAQQAQKHINEMTRTKSDQRAKSGCSRRGQIPAEGHPIGGGSEYSRRPPPPPPEKYGRCHSHPVTKDQQGASPTSPRQSLNPLSPGHGGGAK